ncbi:hypothetical protein [Imbroritus primus]
MMARNASIRRAPQAGGPMRRWVALTLMAGVVAVAQDPAHAQDVRDAQQARLALWVTSPIGASNAAHCNMPATIPQGPPDLTEDDVLAWQPATATWAVDVTRLDVHVRRPVDHCFVLALDGRRVHGVILAPQSARLIRFPTLLADARRGGLVLRLNASHDGQAFPLGQEWLDAILQSRTAP